jgi:hypothetical protein
MTQEQDAELAKSKEDAAKAAVAEVVRAKADADKAQADAAKAQAEADAKAEAKADEAETWESTWIKGFLKRVTNSPKADTAPDKTKAAKE